MWHHRNLSPRADYMKLFWQLSPKGQYLIYNSSRDRTRIQEYLLLLVTMISPLGLRKRKGENFLYAVTSPRATQIVELVYFVREALCILHTALGAVGNQCPPFKRRVWVLNWPQALSGHFVLFSVEKEWWNLKVNPFSPFEILFENTRLPWGQRLSFFPL